MSSFFISPEYIKGNIACITGAEAHHILDVMRFKKGDNVQLFDGKGKFYQGKISAVQAKMVKVKILCVHQKIPLSNLQITLVQTLPKKNKMDYIVEKATELGVDVIIPTQTARSVVKLDQTRQPKRQMRWQRIAQEAAKQCGKTTIPEVKNLTPWKDILSISGNFDLKLLPCLNQKTQKIKNVLCSQDKAKKIILFIGPEGGFTQEEIDQACCLGCIPVSLGINVLKSDTAAIAALAMINYEIA